MFDRVALINLDKRKDRLGAFKAKILACPSLQNYVRYRAVHGDTVSVPGFFVSGGGAWGCRQSHLRVLEDAMLDGVETLLVLEDDVRFTPNFEEKLRTFLTRVPANWEGLMLGGQDHSPGPMDIGIEGIARSRNTQRTHAYVVRGLKPMQALYRLWQKCDRHIDHWFDQWQSQHIVYQPQPWLCGQDETGSDISGRQDTIRYWEHSIPDMKSVPFQVLFADRAVAEELRNLGFHFGNDRNPTTGRDNGLTLIENNGWDPRDVEAWGNVIAYEAVERGDVPGIWHNLPSTDPKWLETRLKRSVTLVEARSVEDAAHKIPQLLPVWRATQILWAWQGEGHEMLEGLAYHGWHRGYWRDEVSGLDQGTRQAVEQGKYALFPSIVKQIQKEIKKIRYGKMLIAHPKLDVQQLRDQVPTMRVEELKGSNIAALINQANEIVREGL